MRYAETARLAPTRLGKEDGLLLAADSIAASARGGYALLAGAP
jgi:hypothetical protein